MPIPNNTINDIKSIIQKFINENGFIKSEEDIQSSYTLKILELLGWDSSKWKINTAQEIKTGNKPDILLKGSSGGTIFIIESKSPKQSLDGKYINKTFKEQICEYCNSEGIYWGVLTNFIEWRIYNSYRQELYFNKKYFTIFDDKLNEDKKVYEFFERISYQNLNNCKGRLDNDPIYYKKQDEIRNEFFENLKIWRHKLRKYLFPKFKKIDEDLLQETVEKITQSILDRLIFMEVCNDKGIISYDILGSILYSKVNKYEELKKKFKELDEKFNSELFAEDPILDTLIIDDEPMEEIIRGINNIDFSKLSVHIIGEVYENYLGELLKKGKGKIKLIESKARAKRKEQGIYYTPDYIVNYIVENTLGVILRNCKTHEEIQKIRVLDPACGSGSFLIRAFDEFYKAYKNCISNYPPRRRQHKQGIEMSLFDDFEIKRKILLYNLHGVDLDSRAVDIAKLNLLIKALEGFTENSLIGRKLLPNLNLNIRCGNSLISGKSLDEKDEEDLFGNKEKFKNDISALIELKEKFKKAVEDNEKEYLLHEISVHEEKINSHLNKDLKKYFKNLEDIKPFNYEVAFCEIFKDGGFDCVIGNPPYVQMQKIEKKYRNCYKIKYGDFFASQMDIWHLFINRGLFNLKNNGYLSFIVSRYFLTATHSDKVRNFIINNFKIKILLDFSSLLLFENIGIHTCILVLEKGESQNNIINFYKSNNNKIKIEDLKFNNLEFTEINQNNLNFKPWELVESNISDLLLKFKNITIRLDELCLIGTGVKSGYDKIFVVTDKIIKQYKIEREILRLWIKNSDIKKYKIYFNNKYLIYTHKSFDINNYPNTLNYLTIYKSHLNEKWQKRNEDYKWFSLYRAREYLFLESKNEILCPYKSKSNNFSLNDNNYCGSGDIYAIKIKDFLYHINFILGILNSKLLNFIYKKIGKEKGGLYDYYTEPLSKIPIRKIDFANKKEKSFHDKLVNLVDEMLKLNKSPERNKIKIEAKDREIDDLVYELYGITDEERKIIEGK